MRVLQINFLNCFSTGNIMLNTARVARERGFVAYTASKDSRDARKADRGLVNHYYIGSRLENTFHRYFSWYTDLQDVCSCFSTLRLIRQIEKVKPDLIHLHDVVGWYLNIDILFKYLKKKDVPIVWTFHDCWAFTGRCIYFDYAACSRWKEGCGHCPQKSYMPGTRTPWDFSGWNWRRKRCLFTSLDKLTIVTPSRWLKELTEESFFAGRDIRVINNGIDLTVFKPKTDGRLYEDFHPLGKKIVLGVAGAWSARKGLDTLVQLSKELPEDYYLLVVGTEEYLGENITTIARTHNPSELAELYSAASVFVNPTLEDNFPTVNLEAIACGTPVVTYRTGGSPESVSEKAGVVVEKGDYEALKKAVIAICEKGKEAFQDACVEASKKYDMNARFNDYVDLYEELLKR